MFVFQDICPTCRGEMAGRAVAIEKLGRLLYRVK
jgi:hypothetical protein